MIRGLRDAEVLGLVASAPARAQQPVTVRIVDIHRGVVLFGQHHHMEGGTDVSVLMNDARRSR